MGCGWPRPGCVELLYPGCDAARSGASLVRDRKESGVLKDPGSAAHHSLRSRCVALAAVAAHPGRVRGSGEYRLVAVGAVDQPDRHDEHVERAQSRMRDRIDRLRQERSLGRAKQQREGAALAAAVAEMADARQRELELLRTPTQAKNFAAQRLE